MKATTPAMAAAFRILASAQNVRTHTRSNHYEPPQERQPRIPEWKVERIRELKRQGKFNWQIARELEVSTTSVGNYLRKRD